jgi:hypothetical protein
VGNRRTFVILASVAGAAVLGGLDLWRTTMAPAVVHFDRAIKRELPLGSSVAQTLAFLRSHGVDAREISYPMRSKDDPFAANYRDGSVMYASVPNMSKGLLTAAGIYMKLAFDAKGRLRDYDVRTVLTVLR